MISATVVVRNEESRIGRCLTAVRPFVDEIVVVDQSSTDTTVEVAKSLADIVLIDPAYGFCEASRSRAIDATTNEWVLIIDADEEIVEGFDLRDLTAKGECIRLRRKTYLDGTEIEDAWHLRLFRKDRVTVDARVHTMPKPHAGTAEYACPDLALVSYKTMAEQVLDNERYAGLM